MCVYISFKNACNVPNAIKVLTFTVLYLLSIYYNIENIIVFNIFCKYQLGNSLFGKIQI